MEIKKETLKEISQRLLFSFTEEEYVLLEGDFKIFLKQCELVTSIKEIDEFDPISFPYLLDDACFREDEIKKPLDKKEVLKNSNNKEDDYIVVLKVVG